MFDLDTLQKLNMTAAHRELKTKDLMSRGKANSINLLRKSIESIHMATNLLKSLGYIDAYAERDLISSANLITLTLASIERIVP